MINNKIIIKVLKVREQMLIKFKVILHVVKTSVIWTHTKIKSYILRRMGNFGQKVLNTLLKLVVSNLIHFFNDLFLSLGAV